MCLRLRLTERLRRLLLDFFLELLRLREPLRERLRDFFLELLRLRETLRERLRDLLRFEDALRLRRLPPD